MISFEFIIKEVLSYILIHKIYKYHKKNNQDFNTLLIDCYDLDIFKKLYKNNEFNTTLIYQYNNELYKDMSNNYKDFCNKLEIDNKKKPNYNILLFNIDDGYELFDSISKIKKFNIIISYNFSDFFSSYIRFLNFIKYINLSLDKGGYFIGIGIENIVLSNFFITKDNLLFKNKYSITLAPTSNLGGEKVFSYKYIQIDANKIKNEMFSINGEELEKAIINNNLKLNITHSLYTITKDWLDSSFDFFTKSNKIIIIKQPEF